MFYNYLFNIITSIFSLVSIPDLMLGETKTPTPRSEEWESKNGTAAIAKG